MVITLSILSLIACGPSAREQAATAYVQQMEALFAENKTITREFINVALGLKKKDLETHEVAERFAERVVPRAAELAQKVDAIQPGTESLMQVHAGIERAWQIRAEAYAQAAKAWEDGELQSFTRAQHDNQAVSAAEERYIEAANTLLAEYQLRLDLYP